MAISNLQDVTATQLQTVAPVVNVPINAQQYRLKKVFIAAEVGAGANQTQHAGGCFVCQLQGIKKAFTWTFEVHRALNGFYQKVDTIFTANGRAIPTLVVDGATGIIKFRDQATHADGQIANGDILFITIDAGN